jgi:hypothetical protein
MVDAGMRQLVTIRVDAQPGEDDHRLISGSKTCWSTGALVKPFLPNICSIMSSPPTTATGSGPPAPDAMPLLSSGSSTRHEQQRKFDPNMDYIRKWIPEFGTPRYPMPMFDHAEARNRALKVYKEMSNRQSANRPIG